ncbi:toll-like receptor 13 [Eupeodes corollae]|uniref:toll-like receptor 13 n=1 Tax=Eupeodes corollae TaxID=290404 RepID=UPI00248FDF37|nr:toll-like receptor 13 [Eupeodes corollae]
MSGNISEFKNMNHRYRILVFILLFYSNNCSQCDATPLSDRSREFSKLEQKQSLVIESIEDFKRDFFKLIHLATVNLKGAIISKIDSNRNRNNGYNDTTGEIESNEDDTDWSGFDESVTRDILNEYILKLLSSEGGLCMMDGLKEHMQTWAHTNGSLVVSNLKGYSKLFIDKSHRTRSSDELLEAEVTFECDNNLDYIVAFSAAYNDLKNAPYKTLQRIGQKLQYLTLKGNNFSSNIPSGDKFKNEMSIAWSTFPKLNALRELDISYCKIEFISSHVFENLTKLTALYISNNKILRVPSQAFSFVRNIHYLDLSNQNALDIDFKIPIPPLEQIINLLVGVRIEQHAFKTLTKLVYLDLSFTKLTKTSGAAFGYLPKSLKYISLCYTSFPVLPATSFRNTKLLGLDMSGNSFTVYSLAEESFAMVAKSLRILLFDEANIKDLRWLKKLSRLEVLSLAKNNIDNAGVDTLAHILKNLKILDLSSNHVGNWYNSIFTNNTKLEVLNLRNNNINILTSEMMKDFQGLHYLGIGDNDFVCDCVLRDFVDIAIANNKKTDCLNNVLENTQEAFDSKFRVLEIPHLDESFSNTSVAYAAAISKYKPMIKESYENIRKVGNGYSHKLFNFHVITKYFKNLSTNPCPNPSQIILYDKINGSTMKFQLLDYEDIHYWCFNETEKMAFFQLDCQPRSFDDIIIQSIQNATKYVVIVSCIVVFIATVTIVVYLKRWHIHYYWSSLKSAALLSLAAKEKSESLYSLSESESNAMYDIFISYCQNDRPWVLEELMPNIEIAGDLSICMHERDFEVGVPILDNIISCMDRSRCLMLLISTNFLLSHWCQFEMRLAQHRMFEASKEHVILVFLEDIPKHKRPKTLQYLMDVKTYIKWPSGSSPNSKLDEKKLFWKRLRRSISNI